MVFKIYKIENCDEKGNIKKDNLTKNEREGLKEAKQSEYVLGQTDKSNKFYID